MSSKEWMEQYSKVKEMIEELNSNCCRDDNRIVCTTCKCRKDCMIISSVRDIMNL